MRLLSMSLIVAGLIWGGIAFQMETTITTKADFIGTGMFSTYVPSQTIHNLELAEKRRGHLIGASVTFIAGILLLGFASLRPNKISSDFSAETKCPFCAEIIKKEATICRFCNKELSVNVSVKKNSEYPPSEIDEKINALKSDILSSKV